MYLQLNRRKFNRYKEPSTTCVLNFIAVGPTAPYENASKSDEMTIEKTWLRTSTS
jgi:hypothetical protein